MSDFGSLLRAEANLADRPGQYERLCMLADAVDAVNGRVERVLALHTPTEARILTVPVCNECSWNAERFDQVEWPCETVRILTGDET